jgi:hypothetical protein
MQNKHYLPLDMAKVDTHMIEYGNENVFVGSLYICLACIAGVINRTKPSWVGICKWATYSIKIKVETSIYENLISLEHIYFFVLKKH